MKNLFLKKSKNVAPINLNNLPPSMAKTLKHANESHTLAASFEKLITPYKPGAKPLIEVQHLTKNFITNRKVNEVLKDINFQINEGENVAILGANGAGKSTTFNIIIGILKPTSGEVKYNYAYKHNYLEQIGIQFQDSSYPKGISTRDVVKFMLDVYKADLDQNVLQGLIEIFGVDEFMKKSINSLSGGQKQRLNALLAIIHKPKVVFLDELSNGLDISVRNRIKEFIKAYAKENGMTICVVSHDVGEIEFLADRIIIFVEGKILVNAYKNEIIQKWGSIEKFVNYYIN